MKAKELAILLVMLLSASITNAQSYNADVDTLVQRMYKDKSGSYELYATQLQGLAQAEPTQWEASYYFSYCKIMQAFTSKGEKIDALLDEAEPVIASLKKMQPNESEFYVLEAMLNQARIAVSPMSRGMKYSQLYNALLDKAIAMNPENPRAYLIKGLGVINMPAMFGGGKKNAKPLFEKAKELFTSFKAPSTIYPSWGEQMNDAYLNICNKE